MLSSPKQGLVALQACPPHYWPISSGIPHCQSDQDGSSEDHLCFSAQAAGQICQMPTACCPQIPSPGYPAQPLLAALCLGFYTPGLDCVVASELAPTVRLVSPASILPYWMAPSTMPGTEEVLDTYV